MSSRRRWPQRTPRPGEIALSLEESRALRHLARAWGVSVEVAIERLLWMSRRNALRA